MYSQTTYACFKDLALGYLEESGSYDVLSHTLWLDMTSGAYLDTLARYKSSRVIDENTRTILHEHGHYAQTLTPYGAYRQWLSFFSTNIMIKLIRRINEEYPNIHPPYMRHFLKEARYARAAEDQEVKRLLYLWLDASAAYSLLFSDNPLTVLSSKYGMFRESVDGNCILTNILYSVDKHMAAHIKSIPGLSFAYRPYKNHLYHRDMADALYQKEIRVAEFSVASGIRFRSLLESSCKLMEFSLSPETFVLPDRVGPEEADYFTPLWFIRSKICSNDPYAFVYTGLALFDVIFSPPSLPHFSSIRGEFLNLSDFSPVSRFFDCWSVLGNIEPAATRSDVGRFETELCGLLGWPTPEQIAAHAHETYRPLPDDPVTGNFLIAQGTRINGFIPHVDCHRLLDALDERMIAPVIEFSDTRWFNHAINDELNYASWYLLDQYVLKVFLYSQPKLQYPYEIESGTSASYFLNMDLLYETLERLGIERVFSTVEKSHYRSDVK